VDGIDDLLPASGSVVAVHVGDSVAAAGGRVVDIRAFGDDQPNVTRSAPIVICDIPARDTAG
jgi:hypothetical protein